MNLKRPLPPDRTFEQIKNHYLVERSIANRLKEADREQRKLIYPVMYRELFGKVPDHPRLTRRNSPTLSSISNKNNYLLIDKFLNKSVIFVEFGPGDCRFSYEVAKKVKFVIGVDISDQRNPEDNIPKNFSLITYDGYNLNTLEKNSADIVFSNQLIEHFHPDDTRLHFQLVHRILKAGGMYVFRTPHCLNGPHDVSMYFSDEPECFHLKEWSYAEIGHMLHELNYSSFRAIWNARGISLRMPYAYCAICEKVLGTYPKKYARKISRFMIPSLCGVAIK